MNFLIASHHFAKFSGHRLCGCSETAAKIIYVTLQDHVIKGSGSFMEVVLWKELCIPVLPKLTAIDIVLMDI